jgi:ParB family transcriptional regulator, chromosome partitioning protein
MTAAAQTPAFTTKRGTAYSVLPFAIKRREGWNPRFDFGEIDQLAKSIAANDLLHPLRVKKLADDHFELVDGDRRLTAIELICATNSPYPDARERFNTQGVSVTVVDRNQTEVDSLVQMFETNSGKPFLPLEAAHAYKRMVDAGMSVTDICKRVGVSDLHVRETMALLEAAPELQAAVANGTIGATAAKAIAYEIKGDHDAQKELTEVAVAAKADKTQRKVLVQKMQEKRAEKAAKQGRTVTGQRACMSAEALTKLEASFTADVKASAKNAKLPTGVEELLATVREDDALAAAFKLGALLALRAALGNKVDLAV